MRLTFAAASLGCALVALTGCGSLQDETAPTPAITVTHTATPSPSTTTEAVAKAFTEPGASVAADGTLVLPALAASADGTQTEVAIEYSLGDVVEAELEDLAGVLSDDAIATIRFQYPVFVHYTATVSGPAVPSGYTVTEPAAMTGITTTGDEASAPVGDGSPALCEPLDVEELTAQSTAEGCWPLLVSTDGDLAALQYAGTFKGSAADYMTAPVTWKVG
ncbi:hypothetical protein [Demequina sp. NBRC 110057]|uniref:hypothetical protein n=1 Tax=Demequina sp. NBRC 110057 TaxID=1570346 RepID=UPI000A07450B|nr:hypothetical protein [Demequina sp. NBRC 110057]